MGGRFVLIHHIGRISGLPDRSWSRWPRTTGPPGRSSSPRGFGPRSDWYQDLLGTPTSRSSSGGDGSTYTPIGCARNKPVTGWSTMPTAMLELAATLPMIRLTPR
jgi:hypothetical protein